MDNIVLTITVKRALGLGMKKPQVPRDCTVSGEDWIESGGLYLLGDLAQLVEHVVVSQFLLVIDAREITLHSKPEVVRSTRTGPTIEREDHGKKISSIYYRTASRENG